MKKIIVSVITISFLMSACSSYKQHKIELPEQTLTTEQTSQNSDNNSICDNENWWEIFNDEILNKFEKEALEYNYDLKSALSRVAQAKAQLTIARSNYYPTINLFGKVTDSESTRTFKNYDIYIDRFTVGLSASYELDLWGKYWKRAKATKQEYLATQADKDAIKLTLTATVAQIYFQMMALDSKLEIVNNTLKSRQDSYDVYNSRFSKGVIGELDLRRVEAEMESVRAEVFEVEQEIIATETALSVLLGRTPKQIVENNLERGTDITEIVNVPEMPTKVPSDLLSRRPDLQACEYKLKSSNAQMSTAKSLLFPTISLTGNVGLASHELEDLFKKKEDGSYNDTWAYSADIVWPVFAGGKDIKNYKVKKEEYEQMLSSYQKTIQQAFKDVLVAINNNFICKNIFETRQRQTQALKRSYELALKRQKAGLTDLLDVLDIERSLLQSEMNLVSAKYNQLTSIITICKALGGGWKSKN